MFSRTRPDLVWHFERRKASTRYCPKMKHRTLNVSYDCDDSLKIFDIEDERSCFRVERLSCNPLRVLSSPDTREALMFCTFVMVKVSKVRELMWNLVAKGPSS